MKVVIAGASGFLGTHLRRRLAIDGHELVRLVRRRPSGPEEHQWWPDRRELDPAALTGADAVVNLAGAGVEDRRWTESYKALIRSSRADTTTTLATAIVSLPQQSRPQVLLNASGVHFYGDTGDSVVDEESPAGHGFLADLTHMWEGATTPAKDAGVRVVKLRTGFPLHADGGLLKPMLMPFRLFVGGKLGDGRQWMPWIAMDDWLGAVLFLIEHAEIAGPVNVVGPAPIRNADFTKALAAALHRPAIMPVPRVALRIVLGEFAGEAVQSLRVVPSVLSRAGFTFRVPDLDSALRAALHR